MPSTTNQCQTLDEENTKKQERVDASSKNENIIPGAFRGVCAETHQGRGENNGGGRVLDGIDWDSVQSKVSSDVSGAETSWIGPTTTKPLHARLLCGIRFFNKNDRLVGNVPACAVKQVCKDSKHTGQEGRTSRRTIAGRKRLHSKRTREAPLRTTPCQLL